MTKALCLRCGFTMDLRKCRPDQIATFALNDASRSAKDRRRRQTRWQLSTLLSLATTLVACSIAVGPTPASNRTPFSVGPTTLNLVDTLSAASTAEHSAIASFLVRGDTGEHSNWGSLSVSVLVRGLEDCGRSLRPFSTATGEGLNLHVLDPLHPDSTKPALVAHGPSDELIPVRWSRLAWPAGQDGTAVSGLVWEFGATVNDPALIAQTVVGPGSLEGWISIEAEQTPATAWCPLQLTGEVKLSNDESRASISTIEGVSLDR